MLEQQGKINNLIQLSKDLDKDKRFMAATDLCDIMLKVDHKIQQTLEKQVCQVFVNQLDDQSSEVSGNAVKCLSQVMNRIQETQVEEIITKVMKLLLKEKSTLSIYSTCAKQVIGDIDPVHAVVVIKSFMPHILAGLKLQQLEPRQDSIQILTDIFKRFSQVITANSSLIPLESIRNLLIQQLSHPSISIRRRATAALSSLSSTLSDKDITQLIYQLLSYANQARKSPMFQITYLQSIAAIARACSFKLTHVVESLIPELFMRVDINQSTIDPGDTDGNDIIYTRIVECLSIIEQFIHGCPRQTSPFVQNIVKITIKLIAFDPNMQQVDDQGGNMQDEDEDQEWGWDQDDDDFGGLDDIDTSWKVRKAAIKIIVEIVKSRPELIQRLYKSDVIASLISRLQEREEQVKRDILCAFAGLINSIKTSKSNESDYSDQQNKGAEADAQLPSLSRAKSSSVDEISEHVPPILKALSVQLQKSKNFSSFSKIKEGILEVYISISSSLPEQLAESLEIVIPDLVKMFDQNSIEIKVGVLNTLGNLMQYTTFTKNILSQTKVFGSIFNQGINQSYFEVQAATMEAVSKYVDMLQRERETGKIALQMYNIVKKKFNESAVDKSVKSSAISAVSSILANFSKDIGTKETEASLMVLVDRAHSDSSWSSALQALNRLARSQCNISSQLDGVLKAFIDLLQKKSGSYKFEVYKTIIAYVSVYSKAIKPTTADSLFTVAVSDINPTDFQISSTAVKSITTVLNGTQNISLISRKNLEEMIAKVVEINGESLLSNEQLCSLIALFQILARLKVQIPMDILTKRSMKPGANLKAMSKTISVVFHALDSKKQTDFISQNLNLVEKFSKQAMKLPSDSSGKSTDPTMMVKELSLALNVIADIGRQRDLSKFSSQFSKIQNLFSSPIEQIRSSASRCIGCVTLGNLPVLLPKLITSLTSDKTNQYLFLESLREVSGDESPELKASIPKLLVPLRQHAKSDNEHVMDIVAENLGRIYATHGNLIVKELFDMLKGSKSDHERATAALSFKFALNCLQEKGGLTNQDITENFNEGIVMELMVCMKKEPFYLTRKNILLSLNSLMNILKDSKGDIRGTIDKIQGLVYKETEILPELIKEVDLGPFKHKVDKGIPLRRAAFDCMQSMLDFYFSKLNLNAFADYTVKGIKDRAEDVKIKCYEILIKFIKQAKGMALTIVDPFLMEASEYLTILEKQISMGTDREGCLVSLRMLIRTLLAWTYVQGIEQHRGFNQFLQKRIKLGKESKPIYEELYNKGC